MFFYYIFFIFFIIQYIHSFPSCFIFEKFCKKCNPLTNLCFKCEYNNLIPDNNGGCIGAKKCLVGINYCNECNIQGDLCSKCEKGYIPDKNGGCSYIENCKISNKGECLECEENFILIGKELGFKMCKNLDLDDFKNCKEIDKQKGVCKKCEEGYFLNSGDKKCAKIENCKESVYGNCISCNLGYYLNKKDNKCILKTDDFLLCKQSLDGKKCDICDEMAYFDEKGSCSKSNFCSESLNGNCTKCISNYYLSSTNKFCSSEKNCSNADKDIGICILCDPEFYLDTKDYKCKSNKKENDFKFCQKVENNHCIECITGYFLSKDNKCTLAFNCLEAENGKCIKCYNKYYLDLDNQCTIIEHCTHSINYGVGCKECEDNFYYNSLTNKCIEALDNFENCKYSTGDICKECKNNFYLDYNDNKCKDNTKDDLFYKCLYSLSGKSCSSCIDNYYLGSGDNKCTLIENCKISKNEITCIECDKNYCLDLKKLICVENDFIKDENFKFYFACIMTNKDGSSCEKCIDGYEVGKEGYCVNLSNCIEEKEGKCIKCSEEKNKNGYYYCANEIFGCIETSFENCMRCDNLFDKNVCTQCNEGYTFISNGLCKKIEEVVE